MSIFAKYFLTAHALMKANFVSHNLLAKNIQFLLLKIEAYAIKTKRNILNKIIFFFCRRYLNVKGFSQNNNFESNDCYICPKISGHTSKKSYW